MTFKKAAIIYTPKISKRKEFKNTSQLLTLIKKISVEFPVFFETKSIEDTRSFISESLAKKEFDVILVAGKGHEDYKEIKGVRYPFDERVIIIFFFL